MSDPKPEKLPALMDLDLTPPDGYPKLPKWDSTLKYKLKDQSLINEVENPFHVDSDLPNSQEKLKIFDEEKIKRLAKILPRNALPPPHRLEETDKYLKSPSRSQTKPSENQVRDQKKLESCTPSDCENQSFSSKSENSKTSRNDDVKNLTKKLEEYYI